MIEILLGIIALMVLGLWMQSQTRYRKMMDAFPGPKKMLLFGNVLQFSREPDIQFKQLRALSNKYKGDSYTIWGGNNGSINVTSPEDVEIILSSTIHIKKSMFYELFHQWLGTGLLTSTGNKWRSRRKILTPAFHFGILCKFVDIFAEHSEKIVQDLKQECTKRQTNVVPLITKGTLNVICETAMGTNLNSNGEKEKNYCEAVYGIASLIVYRVFCPWYYNEFIYNMSPLGWKANKYIKLLHNFTKSVIREREENFKESDVTDLEQEDDCVKSKKRLAMLDLLIHAKNNTGDIDEEGIREEVDTFMFEGHDTTSMALCFSLMLLANHKDIQDKIVQELDEIFGDSQRSATYQDLQNMKFLETCIKECLRLYPSVPFISRELEEDVQLSKGIAPALSVVNIHIYDIHRNAKIFPDPEKFDPDRFSAEKSKGRHPYAYIPFSAGPRNCIGQKFAMLEMKSIVSSILRNYILEPVDTPADMAPVLDIVLRNKNPINVKFSQREKKI